MVKISRWPPLLASASRGPRSPPGCDTSVAIVIGVRLVGHQIAGPIHNDFSAYIAESLYYGRTGYRLRQLDEQHIDRLMSRRSGRKSQTRPYRGTPLTGILNQAPSFEVLDYFLDCREVFVCHINVPRLCCTFLVSVSGDRHLKPRSNFVASRNHWRVA